MHFEMTFSHCIAALVMGAASAFLAHRKGKNPFVWFLIGSLFGIFGLFAFFFALGGKRKAKSKVEAPPVTLKVFGPADKFWYYLDAEHKQHGPMSRDAITGAWKAGKITLSNYVWHEEMPEWKPLQESVRAE